MSETDHRAPEIVVRLTRDGQFVEQRFCDDEQQAAELMESWGMAAADDVTVSAEPHPRRHIVHLLRFLADAIEAQEPLKLSGLPAPLRLQLVVDGHAERRTTLTRLSQELSHPGG